MVYDVDFCDSLSRLRRLLVDLMFYLARLGLEACIFDWQSNHNSSGLILPATIALCSTDEQS